MPFSSPEPGVIHLVIPETGWEPDDRAAFIKALVRSCAEGPTGLFLESNTRKVSPEGPNLMLALFEQLQERIVCLGVATDSSLLQMTLVAFRAAAGLRGLRFPIHVSDDAVAMGARVANEVRARRQGTQPVDAPLASP
jgi:hypothetical protein